MFPSIETTATQQLSSDSPRPPSALKFKARDKCRATIDRRVVDTAARITCSLPRPIVLSISCIDALDTIARDGFSFCCPHTHRFFSPPSYPIALKGFLRRRIFFAAVTDFHTTLRFVPPISGSLRQVPSPLRFPLSTRSTTAFHA